MNQTPETQTLPTTPAETSSFWRRRSTLAIGGTLAAAALLFGGAGIGAALADGDDDAARPATAPVQAQLVEDDIAAVDAGTPAPAATSIGSTDADALVAVLAAARAESSGTVTSMEANRDGSWSVDLENTRGDETTVRVASDGSATVVRTETADADDADDPAPIGSLSDENVAAIVEAALGRAQGVIVDIELDDDPNEVYSVKVRAADGTETEMDLAADFTITASEIDRD